VGAEVVDDAVSFFRAFDGMEHGFEQRANQVLTLLRSDVTAFVLVSSPRADTVPEAAYFTDRLREADIDVRAVVVNRVTPTFGDGPTPPHGAQALHDYRALAARERPRIEELRALAPGAPLAEVPLLEEDVRDLDGLRAVGRLLAG
jgi:anion-transporting  ArsA/GET3 family ATPase